MGLTPVTDGPQHDAGVVVTALSLPAQLEDVVVKLPVTVGLRPSGLVADIVYNAGRLKQ